MIQACIPSVASATPTALTAFANIDDTAAARIPDVTPSLVGCIRGAELSSKVSRAGTPW